MIKVFQLIYVHLLSLFDVNKFIKKTQEGEMRTNEVKFVLLFVVAFFYGYLFYTLLRALLQDGYAMLTISFFLCTIFCLLYDFNQVKALLFQAEDTLFLFSLPIGRKEIVISKLFHVYLKNMFFVVLFMFSALMAAMPFLPLNQTFILLYIVMSLFIPLLPIVISSFFTYIIHHFKMQCPILLKVLLILLCFLLLFFFLSAFPLHVGNVSTLYHKILYFYPVTFLFSNTLLQLNPFLFCVYILLHIGILYIYVSFISSNYSQLCSLLRGRRKKSVFLYKKRRNKKRFFGFVHKELIHLFSYSLYFKSSFYFSILGSVFLILFFFLFPFSSFPNFSRYFSLFGPIVLSVIISTGISTIHAFSLERKHLDMLGSFPISFGTILFAKLTANLIIGSIFLFIDATFLTLLLKPNRIVLIMLYVLPFSTLFFNSFFSLLLDCRFIDKKNQSESAIIKQRLLPIVPLFISFLYLVFPFFFPNILGYQYMLGGYLLLSFFGIIGCFLYYFIMRKKLREQIFFVSSINK